LEAQQLEDSAIWITLAGLFLLVFIKAAQAVIANTLLEKRFFGLALGCIDFEENDRPPY
jgi:hypothetical protein